MPPTTKMTNRVTFEFVCVYHNSVGCLNFHPQTPTSNMSY